MVSFNYYNLSSFGEEEMNEIKDRQLYSERGLRAHIPVSRTTLYRLRKLGMPFHKFGGRIFYDLDSVRSWTLCGS